MVKFADDTTVVGLISRGGDESAYRDEVGQLSTWCMVHLEREHL